MIQHKDIPDAQLHEPKGAETAAVNTVYVADGVGSGAFRKLNPEDLNNVIVDLDVANTKLVTDGLGNLNAVPDSVYGSMTVTNNTNAFSVTAAADATLNTNSDYALFTGTGAPWFGENQYGITFDTDRLIVPYNGVYRFELWSDLIQFPSNTARIAIKYRTNGSVFGPRKAQAKSNSAADYGDINAFALATLNAGDYVQIMLASTVTGGVVFNSMNLTAYLIRKL